MWAESIPPIIKKSEPLTSDNKLWKVSNSVQWTYPKPSLGIITWSMRSCSPRVGIPPTAARWMQLNSQLAKPLCELGAISIFVKYLYKRCMSFLILYNCTINIMYYLTLNYIVNMNSTNFLLILSIYRQSNFIHTVTIYLHVTIKLV